MRRPDVPVGSHAAGRPSDAHVYRTDPATEVGTDVPRRRTARGKPAVWRGIVRRHVAVERHRPRYVGPRAEEYAVRAAILAGGAVGLGNEVLGTQLPEVFGRLRCSKRRAHAFVDAPVCDLGGIDVDLRDARTWRDTKVGVHGGA